MAPTVMERRMQSAAAGPTGTAMRKPMSVSSTAIAMGLKAKPGTFIAALQFFCREAARRRDQPVLRRHELQFALTEFVCGLQHGEDRRSRAAERIGHVVARQPMSREQRGHRVAGAVRCN